MAVSASASGCSLSASGAALSFAYDEASGLYRLTAGGMALDCKWCDTSEGAEVWLYPANGTAAQTWALAAVHNRRKQKALAVSLNREHL